MNDITAPALETRSLSKRLDGTWVLSNVSVTVPKGQIVAVFGPSGAGKSMFVHVVSGLLRPSAGRVLIDGLDLTGARPWTVAAAGVARTFQTGPPFPEMTALDGVAFGAMHGRRRIRSRRRALSIAAEMLVRVGFRALPSTESRDLSVADTKRLEVARAIAQDPSLLILDEVMTGLHGKEVDELVEFILSLRRDGMTVISVEHVLKAVLEMADQIMALGDGRVLMVGDPYETLSDPRVIEPYLGERYARYWGRRWY